MGAMHEQPKKAGGRMRKSILQDRKECFCCGTTLNLERHHVIHGTAGRKIADRLGLTIWLCAEHHRGAYSPHQRRDVDLRYKRFAQLLLLHAQQRRHAGKNLQRMRQNFT